MATKQSLLLAIAGKGAERGTRPEIDEERGLVTLWYEVPTTEREDNLHKQSVRALVQRMGGEDWKVHINSMGESGFTTEVRPAPGVRVAEPVSLDITDEGVTSIEGLADELERLAKKLRQTV